MRFYICQINPTIGDIQKNCEKILIGIQKGKEKKADIVVFPEMALCGYSADDLLLFDSFIQEIEIALEKIIDVTDGLFVVVGLARKNDKQQGKTLYNSAAVIYNKKLLGFKDKTLLPTYDVFNEARYFSPGEKQKVWEYKQSKIGVLICEDLWSHSHVSFNARYDKDPVDDLKKLNPDFVINISASPYYFEKIDLREKIYSSAAQSLSCPLICCNQVGANDELVFDGRSAYFDRTGQQRYTAKAFEEDFFLLDTNQSFSVCSLQEDLYENLYRALILGVQDYFRKQGLKKALVGLSGGIDSAVVLYLCVKALGKENVLAINMPSRFSSLDSMKDSNKLCDKLHLELKNIPIDIMYQHFLDLLSPYFANKPFDTAEENLQARIRGMILMAISNKLGYIVVSTGNKSEMAMGYCTLYGDMCGGLGLLGDVPKTLVYRLAKWINEDDKEIIPKNIINKKPSAELRENQLDQDSLPDYEIVDKVLHAYVEQHFSLEDIVKKYQLPRDLVETLIHKIHTAEYKRRQAPPCIRVTKTSFGRGRYFPIVQRWDAQQL